VRRGSQGRDGGISPLAGDGVLGRRMGSRDRGCSDGGRHGGGPWAGMRARGEVEEMRGVSQDAGDRPLH
jgi:hypothetical protein